MAKRHYYSGPGGRARGASSRNSPPSPLFREVPERRRRPLRPVPKRPGMGARPNSLRSGGRASRRPPPAMALARQLARAGPAVLAALARQPGQRPRPFAPLGRGRSRRSPCGSPHRPRPLAAVGRGRPRRSPCGSRHPLARSARSVLYSTYSPRNLSKSPRAKKSRTLPTDRPPTDTHYPESPQSPPPPRPPPWNTAASKLRCRPSPSQANSPPRRIPRSPPFPALLSWNAEASKLRCRVQEFLHAALRSWPPDPASESMPSPEIA